MNVVHLSIPERHGTIIKADAAIREIMPVFIRKEDQILISILPKDFSFVMGDNLSRIFHFLWYMASRLTLLRQAL